MSRGNVYEHFGARELALEDYSKAIDIDPLLADACSTGAAISTGNRAILIGPWPSTDRSIELKPQSAHAYNNRAITYDLKGDYDHSIADYNRAIALDPEDAATYNNRGYAYKTQGRPRSGHRQIRQGDQARSHLSMAYLNRAIASYGKDDYDRALADYTKALEHDLPAEKLAGTLLQSRSRMADETRMGPRDRRLTRAIRARPGQRKCLCVSRRGL